MNQSSSWKIWLLFIIFILLFLWLFVGRRGDKKEFVGIKPLLTYEEITPYKNVVVEYSDNVTYIDSPKQTTIKYVPSYQKDSRGKMDSKNDIVKGYNKRNFRSKGEEICCQIMSKIYGVPFTNVRLSCLKNPESGCNLEIDCYNDELKIGVEYNGEQHYIFPNNFHRSRDDFIAQVRRDQYKVETCDKQGIYLITVPYNVDNNKIEDYIKFHLPEVIKERENL